MTSARASFSAMADADDPFSILTVPGTKSGGNEITMLPPTNTSATPTAVIRRVKNSMQWLERQIRGSFTRGRLNAFETRCLNRTRRYVEDGREFFGAHHHFLAHCRLIEKLATPILVNNPATKMIFKLRGTDFPGIIFELCEPTSVLHAIPPLRRELFKEARHARDDGNIKLPLLDDIYRTCADIKSEFRNVALDGGNLFRLALRRVRESRALFAGHGIDVRIASLLPNVRNKF